MTKFFADQFRKGIEVCYSCSKSTVKSYGFCAEHLLKARAEFKQWSEERKTKGVCIRCNCKGYMDPKLGRRHLRCRKHVKLNRLQTQDWLARHPEYSSQSWARRKAIRDAGFCPMCKDHHKLDGIHKRCGPCRAKSRVTRPEASKTFAT